MRMPKPHPAQSGHRPGHPGLLAGGTCPRPSLHRCRPARCARWVGALLMLLLVLAMYLFAAALDERRSTAATAFDDAPAAEMTAGPIAGTTAGGCMAAGRVAP